MKLMTSFIMGATYTSNYWGYKNAPISVIFQYNGDNPENLLVKHEIKFDEIAWLKPGTLITKNTFRPSVLTGYKNLTKKLQARL